MANARLEGRQVLHGNKGGDHYLPLVTCAIASHERLSETAETASNVAITSKKILHVAHLALAAIDSPDRTHFEWEQSDRLRRGLLCLFTISRQFVIYIGRIISKEYRSVLFLEKMTCK
jgi:hypothetical protein